MNVLCGMTGFAVSEPLFSDKMNSAGFAKAIMKISLSHGLSHTIIVDKDSKFRGVFEETANMLGINIYVVSGGNHDAAVTERFHVFLNKSLTLFCSERDSTRTATEAIQLCCYGGTLSPSSEQTLLDHFLSWVGNSNSQSNTQNQNTHLSTHQQTNSKNIPKCKKSYYLDHEKSSVYFNTGTSRHASRIHQHSSPRSPGIPNRRPCIRRMTRAIQSPERPSWQSQHQIQWPMENH
jgi:hypothetical protein